MATNEHSTFSSNFNSNWTDQKHEKLLKLSTNLSNNRISSDTISQNKSSLLNQFTIIQRSGFIFSLVVLFWIIFIIIYMSSRLIIRFLSNLKHIRYYYNTTKRSNRKLCGTFSFPINQYGSFRPPNLPSKLIYRSDSLFSNNQFMFNKESVEIHQIFNPLSETKVNNNDLLEHYLTSYNPLRIDLTNINQATIKTSIYEQEQTDANTVSLDNCYGFYCGTKQKSNSHRRYVRLREPEHCSTTFSFVDDKLSECSTNLTTLTLPLVMVTDCSDRQRLHTQIIEFDEDEKKDKQ